MTLHTAIEFDVFALPGAAASLSPTVALHSFFGATPAVPMKQYIVPVTAGSAPFPTTLTHVRIPLSAFYPSTLTPSAYYLDSVETLYVGNTSLTCSDTTAFRSQTPGCDTLVISNLKMTVRASRPSAQLCLL
jgi:hypothetical protein